MDSASNEKDMPAIGKGMKASVAAKGRNVLPIRKENKGSAAGKKQARGKDKIKGRGNAKAKAKERVPVKSPNAEGG
jgi:hypothetical protein